MSITIRGKELAADIRSQIAGQVGKIHSQTGKRPGLAVIQVGDDPASLIYVNNKKRACEEAGIRSFGYQLPNEVSQLELLTLIDTLNRDRQIHGILCQLPLPSHIDAFTILCAIVPEKDVDGFHPVNVGLLSLGRDCLVPCTPSGVLAMLKAYDRPINGQHCVIIGRSNIVGKPAAQLMLKEHATVTIAHSRTRDLPALCREADILIAAVGRPKMITADYIKPGATVIDVGINRDENGKVVGDVDFAGVSEIAGAITPVPNGVGPMTIAMLLQNTLKAFRRLENLGD
ncbi:MAG: bifunctional methylenetetrahydrofolate dehydrogenase/methenyltetrahydrofolate cyclohydrolase FolD [Clostridiaceae bacterium]|nr:bifunctional methylenetetrahydrofolate dehydrogenase/methenyltetrahydrofolate cyclohydrolase FolD [Clostridiaceae bacterium]